jgi:putative transposase
MLLEASLRHGCGVQRPAGYPWSSHRCNAFGEPDPLVRPHGECLALGSASGPAFEAYRALFADASSEERLVEIRANVQQQMALGGPKFQTQIEAALGRYVRVRPAHRPRILRRLST